MSILAFLEKHLTTAALEQVRASGKPALPYRLHPPARNLPLEASRVGGIGYWPQDRNYLRNAVERPLVLLAQFNLGELPVGAAQVLALPASSLLAFYIDPHSDYYGMDALRGNGAVCVYFADTRTPSLPRAAQRALFAADALPYLDGSSDEAEDNLSPAFWQDALAVRNQAATPATNIADGYENMHDVLMNRVARENEENPPDGSWKHPVDGEYAVDWLLLASCYLLRDNREFLRHYGKKQP